MEKWLILELGDGKYKMILKHLLVPESKEVLKVRNKRMGTCQRSTGANLERAPNGQSCNNLSNNINNVVLDYHPKHKINIDKTTVI